MKIALVVAGLASILQLVTGHGSAVTVAKYQPAKLAAYEAHYPESAPATLWFFGLPDTQKERVRFGIGLPGMLSYLVHGNAAAPVTGLRAFPPGDRPPVAVVFQSYHLMVAIGMALIGVSLLGLVGWWRGFLFRSRWLLWTFVFLVLGPQFANQLGWLSAEVGRQPWIVYGLLRTPDGLSRVVTAGMVLTSLILFSLIYLLLFVLFLFLLDRKIKHGPESLEPESGGQRA
jgi:cytochrome d ubiquinol oxidase subunit I